MKKRGIVGIILAIEGAALQLLGLNVFLRYLSDALSEEDFIGYFENLYDGQLFQFVSGAVMAVLGIVLVIVGIILALSIRERTNSCTTVYEKETAAPVVPASSVRTVPVTAPAAPVSVRTSVETSTVSDEIDKEPETQETEKEAAPVTETNPAKFFCSNCGSANGKESLFCYNCGTSLK